MRARLATVGQLALLLLDLLSADLLAEQDVDRRQRDLRVQLAELKRVAVDDVTVVRIAAVEVRHLQTRADGLSRAWGKGWGQSAPGTG